MTKISNKKAHFNYQVLETWVAGIILQGTEIKSIREGKVNFVDSYAIVNNNEVYLRNVHISPYSHGTCNNHEPTRERKLLLKKKEIQKIAIMLKDRGITFIPLSLFINQKGLCKVEIGVCKGKKLYDKRETIKERDIQRDQQREL